MLRLIEGAIEQGCRQHYDPAQRRAVFLAYAQSLFVEVVHAFDTVVAEATGTMMGVAQFDPEEGRLRALFVAASAQGHGHGDALLDAVLSRARAAGLRRIHGAMSLNAVPFYARHGFRNGEGRARLQHGAVIVPVQPMEKDLMRP